MQRFDLIILNLLKEKNLLQKIKKFGNPKIKVKYNKLKLNILFSILIGKNSIIIMNIKNNKIGEIFQ